MWLTTILAELEGYKLNVCRMKLAAGRHLEVFGRGLPINHLPAYKGVPMMSDQWANRGSWCQYTTMIGMS